MTNHKDTKTTDVVTTIHPVYLERSIDPMIHYSIPHGVKLLQQEDRQLLTSREGGRIAVDREIVTLWKFAEGKSLPEILARYQQDGVEAELVRAALACLAEGGLITRTGVEVSETKVFTPFHGDLISVIVVAYNSKEWLDECLPSILAQTYQPLEIILVDNGSIDRSAEWIETHYPDVIVARLPETVSLSNAINAGIEKAGGDDYLILNPDVRLEKDALEQMARVLKSHPDCAAVGAKLKLWWAPAFLNGLGNRVGAFSWGTDNGVGHLDLGQFDHWVDLPSVCFAAALLSKRIWKEVGPVDEGFPMYYEDSDWSYRARSQGYKILAAPDALVYHAFGGRIPTGMERELAPGKLQNVVYGRLRFSIKLLDSYLFQFLRNYLLEDSSNIFRSFFSGKWLQSRKYFIAWSRILKDLPGLLAIRKELKARRTLPDRELFALQREMPVTLMWRGLPELTWDIVQRHYLPAIISGRTRPMPEFDKSTRQPHVLVVSHDIVDVKMAGPGMRYLEMARALGDVLDVTLAIPSENSLEIPGIRMVPYREDRPASLQVLVENCDVAVVSGYMVEKFPFLSRSLARLVVDLYDPLILENLFYYFQEPISDQERLNDHAIRITNQLLAIGDFFICGNERQRDYWMGVLTANGRINPRNYLQDPTLRKLIDIVGIGIPDREPAKGNFIRGVNPSIPDGARIVLWGGGIWNWLDPLTLVRAWPEVLARHSEARLIFLGTRHPNPLVPKHEMADQTERLAAEIGEKDRTILFFEWLSYEEREALLSEADVGVALHPVHVETRYSLRTRVLDYIWARLPILVTEGDVTSEWVEKFGIGQVVPPFDVEAVSKGLNAILEQPKQSWSASFDPLHGSLRWSQVVEPLRRYCLEGEYAPDRAAREVPEYAPDAAWLPAMIARAKNIRRTEGTRTLLHRAWRHLQWRLSRL